MIKIGYCSNVTIYVRAEEKILNQIIKGAIIANYDYKPNFSKIGKNSSGDKVLLVEYDGYKWYEGYSLPIYWENVFNKLEADDYLFTRQGEDWDDIEIDGCYGEAYPISSIEIDVDFE